ncbi:MAG: pilus assembly protein [Myxococcota bacterium]
MGRVARQALAVIALSALGRSASAQTDVNPALPDVLLLVDTSGSMEYKVGTTEFPKCYPDGSAPSEKSRWIELVEVLTGSIPDYRCESIDRRTSSFSTGEYSLPGTPRVVPYDYMYEDPFHRLLSGTCAMGPGTPPTNAYQFSDSPTTDTTIKYHHYANVATSCEPFRPAQDGILDAFESSIRFGLMTFDSLADPSTGLTGSASTTADHAGGMKGNWTYFWGAQSAQGKPVGCTTLQPFDVGARNAAAPPWEGRMVAFGDPSPGNDAFKTKKAQIEKVLMLTRPYGPTPIAGMLKDASDFLNLDNSKDPLDPSGQLYFGPANDPYVNDLTAGEACRKRYIILLSDGQPNMDLRPYCVNKPDCPFDKAEKIAYDMATQANPIETFVVGFALSKFNVKNKGLITCNGLADSDFNESAPDALCNSTDPDNVANSALQACCALNRIAVNGGRGKSPRAFFADNRDELASTLSRILTSTTQVTSRTQPVVSGAAAGAQGFRFYSSVRPISFQPWVGILERQRYECDKDLKPVAKEIKRDESDDFAANVNYHPRERLFASIKAGNGSETVYSERTIRPYYTPSGTQDGAGVYGGTRYVALDDGFVQQTTPDMIKVDKFTCDSTGTIDATSCRNRYMNWLVGRPNGTPFTRCKTPGSDQCYLFGDILHSTPRVVGPPSDFLQDESYARFQLTQRYRPVTLFTSTNDGFLHAFKVAPTDPKDTDKLTGPGPQHNELWAFVPPAILPHLRSQYPFTHQQLLDGAPVVKDVVATVPDSGAVKDIRFERSRGDAQAGRGAWRTVLLQSFGASSPAGGGYFALDVTDPILDASDANNNDKGPRLLWQLTTDATGNRLFASGVTPLITTLFFDPSGLSVDNAREIPVAILPGGAAPASEPVAACPSPARTFTNASTDYPPRPTVRCYPNTSRAGRSLTVVRLDTGEIIRTFRQAANEVSDDQLKTRVIASPIDSPISGQPVAFPSDTGAVADRVFVGDQDGRLWKVNFASTNPNDWKMDLFFDTFPAKATGDTAFVNDHTTGQRILLPPVVSVDANGDLTVNVATGDQETLGASLTTKNYVWSLTEKTSSNRTVVTTKVNWYLPFTNGERTVGPMSLFNSQLFFTSFAPPAANSRACSSGSSKVWGMDYLRPVDYQSASPPRNQGGLARLPDPTKSGAFVQSLTALQVAKSSDAVIFGVSVAQQPSCSQIGTGASNDFLGYRAQQTVTHVTPGQFQLVMHIGGVKNTTATGDQQSNVRTVDLQPPASAARVDSWAALVE